MNQIVRLIYWGSLAGMALITSCKKETEHAPSPYNKIESFAVTTDGNGVINAAVNGDSILVYWPAYVTLPATVSPLIRVSDNASVAPASGTAVKLVTGTKFTVTSQSGAARNYFLKLVLNQPAIRFNENVSYAVLKGGTFSINTNRDVKYLVEDATRTKAYLVNPAGKEDVLSISFNVRNNIHYVDVTVPENISFSEGAYKLKFTSDQVSAVTAEALVGIIYPESKRPKAAPLTSSVTIKRNGTITFSGTSFIDMKDARVYGYNADWSEREIGTFALESFTGTTATYKVPADFPKGTYELGGFDDKGMGIQLRTSDFFSFWSWMNTRKNYVEITGAVTITITD
ncbi:hypothetical protein [Chitinophaga polysaccharea]|uniref:hypothetical protein n=1 Tax=Chitinophaga polysaccharea TaxID=1293035 RepID=UPI00115AAC3D|nr:hypothetical protein [Chitinophaga polysaccharea]